MLPRQVRTLPNSGRSPWVPSPALLLIVATEEDGTSSAMPIPPKAFLLKVLIARLERHRPFSSFAEACQVLISTLEAVEDELTGIPNCPANWRIDGRLYPPQEDHWRPILPNVTRMRAKEHYIFIGANGAMEIKDVTTEVVLLSKAGADGRKVWEQ
jgi:hypothetical protein